MQRPHTKAMSDGVSLSNHLLVAMPTLADPEFSRSVTLVCEHSLDKGALGIVINKPLSMTLGEIFEQMEIKSPSHPIGDQVVLRGGPVHRDRGFVLHRGGGQWGSSHQVSDGIHITTSRDVLEAMANGEGPKDAFIALGYAGWEAGQLEREMRDNAWLTLPVEADLVFTIPFEERWHAVWQRLGVDPGRMSHVAGHA